MTYAIEGKKIYRRRLTLEDATTKAIDLTDLVKLLRYVSDRALESGDELKVTYLS